MEYNPVQYSYARPVNLYAGSPLEEVKALNQDASAQYNIARNEKDQLDVLYNNLDVEDRAIDIKNRAISNLKNRLKATVESGNYQDASFAIQDAKKAYLMDNELQGALRSRQNEVAYQKNLKERLEKGLTGNKDGSGIDEKTYRYAMIKSRQANSSPLKYNPETGQMENSFSGINVSNDLSGVIQDDLMNVTKDWKANGTFTIGDDKYTRTVDKLTGVERVMRNGKEVRYDEVANAMKQYVMNKEPYRRFLEQTREVDKFGRTYNSETGEVRQLDRSDLGHITDEELRNTYRGADDKTIEKLSQSKDLVDKATLEEIRNREKNFDLSNSQVINELYNNITTKDQLNKLVYPSAEKASFVDFEDKIFTDHAALEAIKHKNDKELEKLKKKLMEEGQPPVTQGVTPANIFTGDDYKKKLGKINELKVQLEQAKALFDATPKESSLRRTRSDDYQSLLAQYNAANADVKNFYSDMPTYLKDKVANKIGVMFNFASLTDKNMRGSNFIGPDSYNQENSISPQDLQALIKEAQVKKNWSLVRDLYTAQEALNNKHNLSSTVRERLQTALSSDGDYVKVAAEAFNNIKQKRSVIGSHNKLDYFNSIDDEIIKAYNEENLSKDNKLRTYSVPDLGIKDNTGLANKYHSYAKEIVQNAGDYEVDGKPLDQFIAGNVNSFWVRDEKGKWVQSSIDKDKTKLAIAAGAPDGVKRVSLTFYDSAGRPLVISEEEPDGENNKGRTGVLVSSGDNNTFTPLYNIVSQIAEKNGDSDMRDLLQGELHFGQTLNGVRLGTNIDPFEITSPKRVGADGKEIEANSRIISFKKTAKDASTIIDMTPQIRQADGTMKVNPSYGRPLFGDNNSTFRSNEELLKALERRF